MRASLERYKRLCERGYTEVNAKPCHVFKVSIDQLEREADHAVRNYPCQP